MRRLLPLLLIVLAACQASTVTPDAPSITPSATEAIEIAATDAPTATPTVTITPTLTPSPLPTVLRPESSLPSVSFARLLPNGANSVLGLGYIADPVVSPDQSLILLTTSLGVTMLDATTLQEKWSVNAEHVYYTVWSPDSSKIAVGENGDLITIRDAKTGQSLELLSVQRVYPEPSVYDRMQNVAWSPDNVTLAVSGNDTVLWNTKTDQITTGFGSSFRSYWLSETRLGLMEIPDYQITLLTVWDTTTGEQLSRYRGHLREWSPDFSLVRTRASDSTDEIVRNMAADEQILVVNSAASLSPNWDQAAIVDGESIEIVTLSLDGIGTHSQRLDVGATARYSIWSPDSSRLVIGTRYTTQVWNMHTGDLLCTIEGIGLAHNDNHDDPLVYWFPDGQSFIIALPDENLTVWDANTCVHLQTIPTAARSVPYVASIAFVDQGRRLWVNDSSSLRLWDVRSQQSVSEFVGSTRYGMIGWAEDSRHVIALGSENTILWDIQSGVPSEIVPTANIENYSPPARFEQGNWLSPDDTYYVRQGEDGLEVVSASSHQVLYLLPVDLHQKDGSIAWSTDGRLMAGNFYTGVYVWDTQTWQRVSEWHGLAFYGDLVFSPDGHWLAVDVQGAIVIFPAP